MFVCRYSSDTIGQIQFFFLIENFVWSSVELYLEPGPNRLILNQSVVSLALFTVMERSDYKEIFGIGGFYNGLLTSLKVARL